jgi:hypothetical protein
VRSPRRRGNEPISLDKHMEQYKLNELTDKPVVTVVGDRPRGRGSEADEHVKIMAEMQARLVANNMSTYPNIGRASQAVSKMISYYEKKNKREEVRDGYSG